jgi:O-succinylbenzoic acid--CoA ligase
MDWLAARAEASPEKPALLFSAATLRSSEAIHSAVSGEGSGQHWTYAQLNVEVGAIASSLGGLANAGDRVATLLPNSPAHVMLIHAAARQGLVLVPLNTRQTAAEIGFQLGNAGVSLLVFSEATAELALSLHSHVPRTVEVEQLLLADYRAEGTSSPWRPSPVGRTIQRTSMLESVQAIIYTSGTSGLPKGVMLTFANHFWGAIASAFRLGVDPDDVWLTCLPLYHVGGLAIILRSCLYGTAVELHERFDEAAISGRLDRIEISILSLVPTMLRRLLDYRSDAPWPPRLRHILLGGAALTPDLLDRCRKSAAPVSPTYGLTEAASQVATLATPGAYAKPGSVGKPLMFTRVRIEGEAGQPLPTGQLGEIVVESPTVMAGYWGQPEANKQVMRGGALRTGDLGYLDEDGDLWVVQRRQDLIVCGGENVYPVEVEIALGSHPAVAEACVVGLPDEIWGQQVVAMVALKEGQSATPDDLQKHCRTLLAGYKLPRRFLFAEELPRTASGKIHRQAVTEALAGREQTPMPAQPE